HRENISLKYFPKTIDKNSKMKSEKEKSPSSESEPKEGRAVWDRKIEYLLSVFGYSVGIGNLWRFPYLVAKHGGGAFLVPFFFFLFMCGLPLFMLEVSLGQFSGKSPLIVWSISPLFRGLGVLMICISGIVSWYYNTILSWILYFLVHSFFPSIPWASCNNWWNTDACISRRSTTSDLLSNMSFNATMEKTPARMHTAAYEFWQYNVLRKSSGLDDMGTLQLHLVIAMAVAWILTCLCLVKGVHSVGKVVYVTVSLPYILLTAFLIRGLTLEGSLDGILHYVRPNFNNMFKFAAWRDAATQVFYSLGPAWGGLITMSSYNKFNNKCFSQKRVNPINTDKLLADNIDSSPELVFIAYPEVLVTMPLPNLWGVLFFLMLLTVGIDSQGGYYLLQLVDWYASALCVVFGSFLECMVIAWIYGAERFSRDIELMTGSGVGKIVRFAWCIFTPLILLTEHIFTYSVHFLEITQIMLFLAFIGLSPPTTADYTYPSFAHVVGVIIALVPCLPVPVGMIYGILKEKGSLYKRIKTLIKPEKSWKPHDKEQSNFYKIYEYEGTWIQNVRTNLFGHRGRVPETDSMYSRNSDDFC
ncbi:hypothetical protein FSP39_014370, partial [Pinctada imbricata]